jgi:hypothetical protein
MTGSLPLASTVGFAEASALELGNALAAAVGSTGAADSATELSSMFQSLEPTKNKPVIVVTITKSGRVTLRLKDCLPDMATT